MCARQAVLQQVSSARRTVASAAVGEGGGFTSASTVKGEELADVSVTAGFSFLRCGAARGLFQGKAQRNMSSFQVMLTNSHDGAVARRVAVLLVIN